MCVSAKTKKWWSLSFLKDYICILLLLCFTGAWHKFCSPVNRSFSTNDPSISFPFIRVETVPAWLLFVTALFPVIVLPLLLQFYFRSWKDLHAIILCVLESLWLILALVEFMKIRTGEIRPDYLARLKIGDPKLIKDGRESFPSGHSAIIIALFNLATLYLIGKLRYKKKKRNDAASSSSFGDPSISIDETPTIQFQHLAILTVLWSIAFFICMSRITDNRHHPLDVLVGSLLGLFVSFIIYLIHYPAPWSIISKKPWKPRSRVTTIQTTFIPINLISTTPVHH